MRKIIGSMAISLLLTSNANAKTNTYVSLKYANGSGTETIDYAGRTKEATFDMSEVSLGIGLVLAENNHIELNYNTMNTDGYDLESYGFDYIRSIESLSFNLGEIKAKPELGIGLKYYTEVDDRSGLGLNLGLGVSAEVFKNFELGVGYEYQNVQWESKSGYFGNADTSDEMFDFTLFGRFKF